MGCKVEPKFVGFHPSFHLYFFHKDNLEALNQLGQFLILSKQLDVQVPFEFDGKMY